MFVVTFTKNLIGMKEKITPNSIMALVNGGLYLAARTNIP